MGGIHWRSNDELGLRTSKVLAGCGMGAIVEVLSFGSREVMRLALGCESLGLGKALGCESVGLGKALGCDVL